MYMTNFSNGRKEIYAKYKKGMMRKDGLIDKFHALRRSNILICNFNGFFYYVKMIIIKNLDNIRFAYTTITVKQNIPLVLKSIVILALFGKGVK